MPPRSIWNGTIAFGLVSVPIKVYSATESKTVHFREVHAKDGSKIEHRRICPKHKGKGKTVEYDDIVKGYEVKKGTWVELTDDEIAAAAGSQSKRVDIDHFVPADEIAPEYFERTYYLGAQDKSKDAYALLHAALERTERAGIGRWVFHNRERTVAIRTLGDVIALHTVRFHDELIAPGEYDVPRVSRKPAKQEIDMAASLVDGMHTDFDPTDYSDTYRKAVLTVVKAKAAGKNIEPPPDEEPEGADDLLAALEASLANA
ncbi:MAG TPA: Ku protein [Acidimicrobiia bacterium]|jgi:DNA end-binding protein Ku